MGGEGVGLAGVRRVGWWARVGMEGVGGGGGGWSVRGGWTWIHCFGSRVGAISVYFCSNSYPTNQYLLGSWLQQGNSNLIVWVSVCYKFYRCSGTKPIAFVAVDNMRTRPFIQTSLRNGFGKLSPSFIYELLIYLQCAGVRLTTLLEMLLQAIHHIIPALEINDELIETILMRRQVNMEPSDEEVDLATEFVLDAFSVADQEALQKEITSCKAHTEEWTSFKRAFKAYKVAFIFRSLYFGIFVVN